MIARVLVLETGRTAVDGIWRLGFASRFFLAVLMRSGTAFTASR
jgi:phospholipid/cholesterol/gamma-HCH transport system permease protein